MTAVVGARTTVRGDLLADAIAAVEGDRNNHYGDPTDNLAETAAYWNTYLDGKFGTEFVLSGADVAAMQVLLKVARLHHSSKRDTWLDVAGYAGCGWECAV